MKDQLKMMLLSAGMAAASVINQSSAEGVNQRTHVKQSNGDSFFAKPVEGYPAESNLALTHSFIFGGVNKSGSGKSVHMGTFEVDVVWLYILGALIVIGVVIGAIICCCTKKDDEGKKEDTKEGDDKDKEKEKNDEEKGDDKEKDKGEGEPEKKPDAEPEKKDGAE